MNNKQAFRSVWALALALVMLLSLMSCGKKPEPDTSKPTLPGDVSSNVSSDVSGDTTGDADDTTTDMSGDTTTEGDAVSDDTTISSKKEETIKSTSGKITKPTTKPTTKQDGPIVSRTTTSKTTTATTATKTTVDSDKSIFGDIPDSLSGQKVKVLVWWDVGDFDKGHAAKFNEETGITVSFETIANEKYQTRLSAMIMGNNAPTCAAMISDWYPQPITRGLLQPIKNTGWDFTEEIYATSLMDQFAYKGEQYGIALKGSNMTTFTVVFFNKDLLRQFGVAKDPYQLWKEGNWNWDTCLAVAKQCTNQAKGMYGISVCWQYYWMLSAGQDFVFSTKDGLVNNTMSTEVANAWSHAWRMIHEYKVVDNSFTDKAPFYAGTSAMLAIGSYMMQTSGESHVPQSMKADWGVAPFPSPKGMDTVAGCEGTVWGFPSRVTGDNLQAGAWFLRYWLDDSKNTDASFYAKNECWEIMSWMWNQKIQSFNSIGILSYGGEYNSSSVQHQITGESTSLSMLKSNLDSWYSVVEANIEKIETELS